MVPRQNHLLAETIPLAHQKCFLKESVIATLKRQYGRPRQLVEHKIYTAVTGAKTSFKTEQVSLFE